MTKEYTTVQPLSDWQKQGIHYANWSAGPALAPAVSQAWEFQVGPSEKGSYFPMVPDGRMRIYVICDAQNIELFVSGPKSTKHQGFLRPGCHYLGVNLHWTEAFQFIAPPLTEIKGYTNVAFNEVANLSRYDVRLDLDKIFYASSTHSRRAAFRMLIANMQKNQIERSNYPTHIERLLRRNLFQEQTLSVNNNANEIGFSRRQLTRHCNHYLGLGPKTILRILRFQKTYRHLIWQQQADISAVAQIFGYYDQAHMIHEFKDFHGASPSFCIGKKRG